MAWTAAAIKTAFPELNRAPDPVVEAKLADAERATATDFASDATLRDQYVGYYTAHLISQSPYGEFARLKPDKEPDGASSIYEREMKHLVSALHYPIVI